MLTVTLDQIWIYLGAMCLLVISPGPVVAAILARVLARGFHAMWPIALSVMLGDFIWVSLMVFGVGEIVAENAAIMKAVLYAGAAYLCYLGYQEIRHASEPIDAVDFGGSNRFWAVFMAGFVVIMTNPKAVLFYLSFLPRFFNIAEFTYFDTFLVAFITAGTAFLGNIIWGLCAGIASKQFSSVRGRTILRSISGFALIIVAIVLVFMD